VYRADAGGDILGGIYRVPLRERLPSIGVPLRSSDDDAPLDLQALLDQCYRNGGYDEDVDYQGDADPPLDPDDRRWADAVLRKQGIQRGRAGRKPARNGKRRRGPKAES
jgi:hypothetical protein